MQGFDIRGTHVEVNDLLKLQTLAVDLNKLNARYSRSKRAGEQRSKFRGQGREFIEMKHYQSGDDVRQIDWRLTAKKQSPYVRVMEEDRHSEHVIWLALSARQYFGTKQCFKSVMACHWAAFLVWRFSQLKHPVRLFIQVTPNWQREIKITQASHAAQACQHIAQAHLYLSEHFSAELESVKTSPTAAQLPHWQGHPNLWLISDFLDDQLAAFKKAVSTKPVTTVTCLQTMDLFDEELPKVGALPVKSKHQSGWLMTQQPAIQKQYQQAFTDHVDAVKRFCWQYQGQLIAHYTHRFQWQEVQTWPLHH